jgi:hypothetical protein
MRFASFILIVLLSETSLTFAQGHMGTIKSSKLVPAMRSALPTATR